VAADAKVMPPRPGSGGLGAAAGQALAALHRHLAMLDRLTLPPRPALQGERVLLRGRRESDLDDRLRHPIDPKEEDGYGAACRREWDGRRYHTWEQLTAAREPLNRSAYCWAVEYDHHCIGSGGRRWSYCR
jgi:hypothetical protein